MCIGIAGEHMEGYAEAVDRAVIKNMTDREIRESIASENGWWPQSYVDVVANHIVAMAEIKRNSKRITV
jgi:hypothetical protein